MASNPMIVNSSFFDSLKQYYYLKSGRIFAPDFDKSLYKDYKQYSKFSQK